MIEPEQYETNKSYQRYQDTRIKRINIYYILKLLYGDNRKYYRAFTDSVKRIFTLILKADPDKTIDILDAVDSNIVDFVKIEAWLRQGVLEKEMHNIHHERFVIEEFIKHYNGDLIDTLDRIYYTTYPGDLGRLVLAHSEVIINA